MMMRRVCLALAMAASVSADTGTSASDLCQATCTGSGTSETCSFTAKIDPYSSYMGYWKFDECGDTVMPYLAIEQNVEYTFIQSDESNWYHPLGFAYFADGAHNDVDELEPGITQTSDSCASTNQCDAPKYYSGTTYLGAYDQDTANNDGDFGLDVYEPEFFLARDDWLAAGTYSVKLTITDTAYTDDIFYFCHIHNEMSGYMKIVDSSGALVGSTTDSPARGYDLVTQGSFDQTCGTYDLDDYQTGGGKCDDTFVCDTSGTTLTTYASCLNAMDCHMQYNMKSYIATTDPVVTFCHQMIPHHQNAVNMAKVLMAQGTLTDDDSDAEISGMLWAIMNVQNYQINIMNNWLDAKSYDATDLCTSRRKRRLRGEANTSAPKAEKKQRRKLTDTGTSADDLCQATCTTVSSVETCSFTAKINPYASYMGYWQFDECGDTVMPYLEIKQNVEYTFDQSDESNWYHPLGFAYFADGAHKDVDELEPGITQTSSSCAADNTCDAPKYYKAGVFVGGTYDQTTAGNDGDFGLDAYEPEFFYERDDWLAAGTYSVKLTITDTTFTDDIFYFCHIHNEMSGRMKIVDSAGAKVSSTDTPELGYSYAVPSSYDASCGTYDVSDYQTDEGMCDDTFVCDTSGTSLTDYAACLNAMDCHQQYNMKSYIASTDPVVTFCHQMIPHHQNAVNMAKLLMYQNSLTDDDSDAEVAGMLWAIINVQNYQINIMNNWLDAKDYDATNLCTDTTTSASSSAIAGYTPASDVFQHSYIDKDQEAMESWLSAGDYTNAYLTYSQGGNSAKSSGYRTLQGFSKSLAGEPMYDIYQAYWGSDTYADDFVSAALLGTTDPGSGVDFGALDDDSRIQLAKKGSAYQNVWMYVLHELEAAIVDCNAGENDDAGGSPHAWDEGWAFWAGSQQSAGATDGYLIYTLAEKRCTNFGTCGSAGTSYESTDRPSKVNRDLLTQYNEGLAHLQAAECTEAAANMATIKSLMTVPLVQGTMRYAYKCDPLNGNEGAEACSEGYAFAAAVLPQIHTCDATAATTIKTNMKPGANLPDGYEAVKAALEGCYESMGITCDQVGNFLPDNTNPTVVQGGCASSTTVSGASQLRGLTLALAALTVTVATLLMA
jgi:uncharacterized protein (DUF305 family)